MRREEAAQAISTRSTVYMADQITEVCTRAATTSATSRSSPAAARARSTAPRSPTCCTSRRASSRPRPALLQRVRDVRHGRRPRLHPLLHPPCERSSTSRGDRGLYAEMEREALEAFERWASPRRPHARSGRRTCATWASSTRSRSRSAGDDRDRRDARAAARRNFHAEHEAQYGFTMPGMEVEFLTFRVRATTAPTPAFTLQADRARRRATRPPLKRHARRATGAARPVETPVYVGAAAAGGQRVQGPAIIEEHDHDDRRAARLRLCRSIAIRQLRPRAGGRSDHRELGDGMTDLQRRTRSRCRPSGTRSRPSAARCATSSTAPRRAT